MRSYTGQALRTIQLNIADLSKKLASAKPNEDLSADDIENIMYYLKAFANTARTEEHRREVEARRK